jgi:hypothetical protein
VCENRLLREYRDPRGGMDVEENHDSLAVHPIALSLYPPRHPDSLIQGNCTIYRNVLDNFTDKSTFFFVRFVLGRPCNGSDGYSPASHRGGPGSIPGQSMWDLWWTKWHWDRFFSEYFGFPLSISFHRCSITWKNKKN